MERKTLSFVLMCVVIGMLAGQGNAWFKDFKNCLKDCLVQCAIPPWTPICPASCITKCIIHPSSAYSSTHATHQFCTAGCATTLCSKLITENNPNLDQVESCVNGCSGTCKNNYVPAN
ncbi:thionin-like protein 2 [Mercurialis annua]|uniref:thionin-like protein 2 n=1 Tax=Mercurialis annua TaxID=3986 RepID=UPI00215FAFB9|nr:thionin-like protein 2 [Mercurialis annua]